ncbi:hypothetical protein GALMADRAFT_66398, partial [Galerina marginata CBS 339.88]
HDFSGTMLQLEKLAEKLAVGKLDYYIWLATRKVLDMCLKESPKLTQQERVSRVMLELACAIGKCVTGPHTALLDPRNHDNSNAMVKNAQRIYTWLRKQGLEEDNICVSIPATEAGIRAAQCLEKDNINVNLYLVTSLIHAAACAEAKAAIISVPVGPLLDAYEWNQRTPKNMSSHPGITAVQTILAYFKKNKIRSRLVGTSFRNLAEIGLLSDFDAVCVSPEQADRLRWSRLPVTTLEFENAAVPATFRAQHAKYPTDLLTRKGGFSTWFSPESRNLTTRVLCGELDSMRGHMDTIEHLVALEVKRQSDLRSMSINDLYDQYWEDTAGKDGTTRREPSRYEDILNQHESFGIPQGRGSERPYVSVPDQDLDDIF